jgi:dihydroxyacetone kinase-like protein
MSITTADILDCLQRMAAVIAENKAFLTELDSAIGDADHGIIWTAASNRF